MTNYEMDAPTATLVDLPPAPHRTPVRRTLPTSAPRRATAIIGGFYLVMAGINIGLSIGDPLSYQSFGADALFGWVGRAWDSIFMAAPDIWAKVLGLGEIALGVLLLTGGRWARAGYLGTIAFHVALLLFGWWAWLWAVPALAVLVPLAVHFWRQTTTVEVRVR